MVNKQMANALRSSVRNTNRAIAGAPSQLAEVLLLQDYARDGNASFASVGIGVELLGPGLLLDLLKQLLEFQLVCLPQIKVVPDLADQDLFEL